MRQAAYVLLTVSMVMLGTTQVQGQTGPYQVRQTFQVGGKGGWDYLTVDPEHGLLYVPRTTHTMVLDAATGKTVADIPGQRHNHGVAIVPSVGRGFISDGEDGSVTIFDLKTNEILGKVKAAVDADGIIYDLVSRKVLVSCGDAGVLIPISVDVTPKTGRAERVVRYDYRELVPLLRHRREPNHPEVRRVLGPARLQAPARKALAPPHAGCRGRSRRRGATAAGRVRVQVARRRGPGAG